MFLIKRNNVEKSELAVKYSNFGIDICNIGIPFVSETESEASD